MKYCLDCEKPKSDKGSYCKVCGYKHRVRPKGLLYIKHKENPTSFKKGQVPWNKGTKGICKVYSTNFKKGEHFSPETEFKKGTTTGERNYKWKGAGVGYHALHTWLVREYGKPTYCEECGVKESVQWASKDYSYTRDRDSWVQLCFKCHRKYDSVNGWGNASKKFPEIRSRNKCIAS
jgi:hypothetical protein